MYPEEELFGGDESTKRFLFAALGYREAHVRREQ
jgi:hypothetical protein